MTHYRISVGRSDRGGPLARAREALRARTEHSFSKKKGPWAASSGRQA